MSIDDIISNLNRDLLSCSSTRSTDSALMEPKPKPPKRKICMKDEIKAVETLAQLEASCQSFQKSHLGNLYSKLKNPEMFPLLIYETAETLGQMIKSSGVQVYFKEGDELILYKRISPKKIVPEKKIPMSDGSNVGVSVALQCTTFFIEDISLVPECCPYTVNKVEDIKSLLCLPLCDPEEKCLAVFEFYRQKGNPPFDINDKKYVIINCGWIGASLRYSSEVHRLQNIENIKLKLLNLVYLYSTKEITFQTFIEDIVHEAKSLLKTKSAAFYVLNKVNGETLVDEYVESKCNETKSLFKRVTPKRSNELPKILTNVIEAGERMVIMSSTDPRFGDHDRHMFGMYIRNIILLPLTLEENDMLGVLALMNKDTRNFESEEDSCLQLIEDFLSVAFAFRKTEIEYNRCKTEIEELRKILHANATPCKHDVVKYEGLEGQFPDGFSSFSWYIFLEELDTTPLLVYEMLKDIAPKEMSDKERILKFLLTLRSFYRDLPFHNYEHAFNVCHCAYTVVKRNAHVFSLPEQLGLVIGAICHDVDHRGVTNNFLMLTKDTIAQLYDESPMENHHFDVSFNLINNADLLKDFCSGTASEIMNHIKNMILATDLAEHFQVRARCLPVYNENGRLDLQDPEQKSWLNSFVATASDLSGNSKPFDVVRRLVNNLYIEFYEEGDMEKKLFGLKPLAMMDREQYDHAPRDQVYFIDIVVLPCLEVLAGTLPNTEEMLLNTWKVRKMWKNISKKGPDFWKNFTSSTQVSSNTTIDES